MNKAVKVVVKNRIAELKEMIRLFEIEIDTLNEEDENLLRKIKRAKFNIKNYEEEKEALEKELLKEKEEE